MEQTPLNTQPVRIYFIRHGETAWSLSGRYAGSTDIPLTPQGQDEARAVGQRLRDIPFAHVLTSPLQRAQRTCALAGLGATPKIEPDLAEWNSVASGSLAPPTDTDIAGRSDLRRRAIERWENEGGEIK